MPIKKLGPQSKRFFLESYKSDMVLKTSVGHISRVDDAMPQIIKRGYITIYVDDKLTGKFYCYTNGDFIYPKGWYCFETRTMGKTFSEVYVSHKDQT